MSQSFVEVLEFSPDSKNPSHPLGEMRVLQASQSSVGAGPWTAGDVSARVASLAGCQNWTEPRDNLAEETETQKSQLPQPTQPLEGEASESCP